MNLKSRPNDFSFLSCWLLLGLKGILDSLLLELGPIAVDDLTTGSNSLVESLTNLFSINSTSLDSTMALASKFNNLYDLKFFAYPAKTLLIPLGPNLWDLRSWTL